MSDDSIDGKKKIGAYLSKKGMAIGTSIGTSLVVLGGVLEEKTGYLSAFIQMIKTWIM